MFTKDKASVDWSGLVQDVRQQDRYNEVSRALHVFSSSLFQA